MTILVKRNEALNNFASPAATAVLLTGLLSAFTFVGTNTPDLMIRKAAIIVGATLLLSFIIEARITNLRNLIRVDNAAIFGLYFLTFFEFLFPQEFINHVVTSEQARNGINLVLLGLGSIAVGRHLITRKPFQGKSLSVRRMTASDLFWLAVFCFVAGHLHMWIAVDFNPIRWLTEIAGPRFSQSWQRGRLGGWGSFLSELHWLTFLTPAITSILWVNRKETPRWMIACTIMMLILVLYSGISIGARYLFAFYLLSFFGAYFLIQKSIKISKILTFGAPVALIFLAVSFAIVNLRSMGVQEALKVFATDSHKHYSAGGKDYLLAKLEADNGFQFIIDRNMHPLSILPSYFPEKSPFLQEEIVISILARPIPRAFWPGKPESLSITTESILGVRHATIASTCVGEFYMGYGRVGVLIGGLLLGILLGWWNRIPVNTFNPTITLLYASGFIWAAVAMRSIVWITMGFLPAILFFLYITMVLPVLTQRNRSGRKLQGNAPTGEPIQNA